MPLVKSKKICHKCAKRQVCFMFRKLQRRITGVQSEINDKVTFPSEISGYVNWDKVRKDSYENLAQVCLNYLVVEGENSTGYAL